MLKYLEIVVLENPVYLAISLKVTFFFLFHKRLFNPLLLKNSIAEVREKNKKESVK